MKTIFAKSIGTVSVISLAVLFGCTYKTKFKDDDLPTKVKIETVKESKEVSTFNYVGTIEEKTSTALSFSSMGMIEKIYVSEGEFVSGGQLLAKIDPSSAQSMLDVADASLKQAQDGYDRLKSIYDKGSLTEIQMVDIETKLQQAKSAYNIAEKNLENCSLHAPASGVIGKKMAEVGEYSVMGKAVLTILDISSVKIGFSIPENEISIIPTDCKSTITVAALGHKEFNGKKIEKSVKANAVSHTYLAHIILSNPQKELLPGMVCRIALAPENKVQEIVIPISTIQTTSAGHKFVWIDKGGTAKRMFVTTGAAKGNGVEVTSGLSAGDSIVTDGYQKISEDDKITGQ